MTDELRSRLPEADYFPEMEAVAVGMTKIARNGAIPSTTISLVHLRAGQITGTTYHTVRHAELLRKAGEPEEKITAVASWTDAPYFTEAERVALELVEAVLAPHTTTERVPDEMFERAAAQYDDKELWTLTLIISQIMFFIPVATIAKPIPGKAPGKNYTK
ncbi:MAG: carboxymuconolactone decarboxylase family protein [Stackebrandtia sp.]